MLIRITNTAEPATDLGFLLHKNPATFHSAELSFGNAHVFYEAAEPRRCTACLLLEVGGNARPPRMALAPTPSLKSA